MITKPKSTVARVSSVALNRQISPLDIGIHINKTVLPQIAVNYGAVRSHSTTMGSPSKILAWRDIETSKGVFDWTNIDQWVAAHEALGHYMVCDILTPPDWAVTASAVGGSAWGGKSNLPPTNNQDVIDFVTAFVTRFTGRVHAYDGWNEPNLVQKYYVGTAGRLAEIQRIFYQTVKAIDPAAIVLSPEFTSVFTGITGGTSGQVGLREFLAASDGAGGTGAQWFDVCAYHFYCNDSALRPSALWRMYSGVKTELTTSGRGSVDIWATETGVIVPNFTTLTTDVRNSLLRLHMYTLFALGCKKVFWFSVDETFIGFMTDTIPVWNTTYYELISAPSKNGYVDIINLDTSMAAYLDGFGYAQFDGMQTFVA